MDLVVWMKRMMVSVGAEWVMWLMLGLSVVSIAIIVERAWLFRSVRDNLVKLARDLGRALDVSFDDARQRLVASPSAEAAVVLAGLDMAHKGPKSAERAMAGAAALQRMKLERRLAFLATLGNNAPFIGLFGTVIGIVGAFAALDQTTQMTVVAAGSQLATPEAVMASIGEALVATAIGIAVAIPAVAANNYFQRTIKRILANTEALSQVLLAHLSAEPTAVAAPGGVPTDVGRASRVGEE